jgi:hypothetical protein
LEATLNILSEFIQALINTVARRAALELARHSIAVQLDVQVVLMVHGAREGQQVDANQVADIAEFLMAWDRVSVLGRTGLGEGFCAEIRWRG